MTSKRQLVVAASLVTGAVAVVLFVAAGGQEAAADGEMEGHNHAAMTAGSEAAPVRLDGTDARRIGVTYAAVEHRSLSGSVRTVGILKYDETRLVDVSPKIRGWVERLHVDFTGAPVRKGQPLMEIYAPELVSAQEELILARRLVEETSDVPESRAARNARELLSSARRRLAYWDVPEDEIRRIESGTEATRTLTLRAPATGIVVEKNVVEGGRIGPELDLYRIADLSTVWMEAEVFEKDLSLVETGQRAEIRFETYPGETFGGLVTYVYPTVETHARTGTIRLELANPGLRLKPGMYADVHLATDAERTVLAVPRSAILDTGERTLVFVRGTDGSLVPREVEAGLRAGEWVEVVHGLAEGDTVVSSGNFLVDAESNLGSLTGGMETMEMESDGNAGSGDGHAPASGADDASADHSGHDG